MSELKLPDLNSVYQNYLKFIEPLLTTAQWQSAQENALDFITNEGIVLQQILQNDILQHSTFAKYLQEKRIKEHLSDRDLPVSLKSNLGLRINWRSQSSGIMRLAEFISSALLTHQHFLNGSFENLRNNLNNQNNQNRQNQAPKRQWQFLQGAARCPNAEIDELFLANPKRVLKNIGVFWQYRFFILPVMNKNNEILGTKQIAQALEKLLNEEMEEAEIPFASLSFAGKDASEILQKLLTVKQNQQAYQLINETLFTITLKEDEVFSDSSSAMEDATYGHGVELWAFKPLNYIYYLADDGLFLHSETSWIHAQGLIELISINKENLNRNLIVRDNLPFPGEAKFREISWSMDEKEWREWLMAITEYDKKLELYTFSSIEVEVERLNQPPQNYDFIMQTMLAYGYLRALGRLRNLTAFYDWSNFKDAWLGDMQPISHEVLVLINNLIGNKAQMQDFDACLMEYKRRKNLLDSGISCVLYLKELENTAKRQSRNAKFFKEPGFRIISQNFIKSYGQGIDSIDGIVKDIGFAPPSVNGLGINYGFTGTSWRFLISHSKANQVVVNQFMLGIEEAWKKLDALLNGEMQAEIVEVEKLETQLEQADKKSGFMSRFLNRKDKSEQTQQSGHTQSTNSNQAEEEDDDDDDW